MTVKNPPHPGAVVLQECIEPLCLSIKDQAEAAGSRLALCLINNWADSGAANLGAAAS